jgi:para-nitrobenzyl esterase
MERRTFLAAAGSLGALAGAPAFGSPARPVVPTSLGPIRGTRESGLHVFRGIRYGIAERFMAPRSPLPSREIVEVVRFGPPRRNVGTSTSPKARTACT